MSGEDQKIPHSSEIDKALEEFEAQSKGVAQSENPVAPQRAVEGISFETDDYKAARFSSLEENPRMVKWVIKYSGGLIKDKKQAEYVLLGVVVTMFILSFFFFFNAFRSPVASPIDPAFDMPMLGAEVF